MKISRHPLGLDVRGTDGAYQTRPPDPYIVQLARILRESCNDEEMHRWLLRPADADGFINIASPPPAPKPGAWQ